MRLIHTSDWHLGRLFHGVHLTEDQAHVLDQLVDLVRDCKPDAVLTAGDVFDRAVPPPDSVEVLDEILSRTVLGLGVPVIMIAGNHDSPIRLGFGSRVLARSGLHVRGALDRAGEPVILEDKDGPVAVYTLPYAEPATVRESLGLSDLTDQHTALAARIQHLPPRAPRSILMAHAFVAGGTESESERPLSVGGVGTVDKAIFRGYQYVALGHLHRPQSVGEERIHYPGSLLKYSFSEADHKKSVSLVELSPDGGLHVERITLTPRRDLRRVSGLLKDLLEGPSDGKSKDDYLQVTLLDKGAILDAIGRLREVYPNVLHLERPFLSLDNSGRPAAPDYRRLNETELFMSFFQEVTGEKLTQDQEASLIRVVDEWRRSEREA